MSRFFLLLLYSLIIGSCGQPSTKDTAGGRGTDSPVPNATSPDTCAGLTDPAVAPTPCQSFTPSRLPSPTLVPEPIYGVTIESAEDFFKDGEGVSVPLLDSLNLSRRPTVRLIFNRWRNFTEEVNTYQKIAQNMRPRAYLMGEILDSKSVKDVDTSCYLYRTAKYVEGINKDIDIWEIGNEVNGSWLRKHENTWSEDEAAEVSKKIYGAYKIVDTAGGKTALTLYYNDDHKGNHCWNFKKEEMFNWAANYVPPDMRDGLDYVLISFYEDDPGKDCRNQDSYDGEDQQFDKKHLKEWRKKPLDPDWIKVFTDLAVMFPNARIGFGECGTKPEDKKSMQLTKYYKTIDEYIRLNLPAPYKERYIGGYFWWYFKDDMVPQKKRLWVELNNLLKDAPMAH